jgi:hypothetical protein
MVVVVLVLVFVACLLSLLAHRAGKHGTPKRTVQQEQADELITVVLPTIKDH